MISALLLRIKGWALAALAVLAVIGGAFLHGRSKGRQQAERQAAADNLEEDNAALRESLDAAKERNNAELEVSRLPDGGSADRLRNNWSRD